MPRLLIIPLLFGMHLCFGQTQQDDTGVAYDSSTLNVQEIGEEDLQEYRNDPAFEYEIAKNDLTWLQDFMTWMFNLFTQFFEWLFGIEKAGVYLAFFLKLIPYLLLAVLLFLLIKFFLNVNANTLIYSKQNQAIVTLSEDEHILKNEDIDDLLEQALTNQDYRLAIRYYYLLLLKLLGQKEYIDWEPQKTNLDYVSELKTKEIKDSFSSITRLYDYIWYGGFHIDEVHYQSAATPFAQLKKKLDSHA